MPSLSAVILEKIAGKGLTSHRSKLAPLHNIPEQPPSPSPFKPCSPGRNTEISPTSEDLLSSPPSTPNLSWGCTSTLSPSLLLPRTPPFPRGGHATPTSDLEALTCRNGAHSEAAWKATGRLFHGARPLRLHWSESGVRRPKERLQRQRRRRDRTPVPPPAAKKSEVKAVRLVLEGGDEAENAFLSSDEEEDEEEESQVQCEEGLFEMEDVLAVEGESELDWRDVDESAEKTGERVDRGFEASEEKVVEWWRDCSFFNC